ncbi:hypothetical protein TNCV_2966891 [Trichonephila clavipes]|nr:hypothetical protein TNCV_2966891 [Trichonephila clavipes]
MVGGSAPAGVDRFYRCENRRLACHIIMWHVKNPLEYQFGSGILGKIKSRQYLASEERLIVGTDTRWGYHELALTFGDLPYLQKLSCQHAVH